MLRHNSNHPGANGQRVVSSPAETADTKRRGLAQTWLAARQPGEPNSVLNLIMPPKGGNPALDDPSLHDVVAFLRTLRADAQ